MRLRLIKVTATAVALAIAVGLTQVACSLRSPERAAAPPDRVTRDAYGPPQPESDRTDEMHCKVLAGIGPSSEVINPAPTSPGASYVTISTPPTNSRDLGKGGGGEKLAGRNRATFDRRAQGEGYARFADNLFVAVATEGGDASTFGLDVDTAAYSNVRRILTADTTTPVPVDAVRIEEMINNFTYAYPAPAVASPHPFAVTTSVAACPWTPTHQLLRVAVQGRQVDAAQRAPMNLVFLVDVSGSMEDPAKLPLVVRTLKLLIAGLRDDDRVAIVTYAGSEEMVLASTLGRQRELIIAALTRLSSGGSTNGEGGIRRAYQEAARHHQAGVLSRVVICTDGDFNVGISDPAALKQLMQEQAAQGIFCNVFGYGSGNYQDQTAKAIAANGNGVYSYIDSATQAQRVVGSGLSGQLVTIAKDAKCQVFFNPAVIAGWRLIGYEYRLLARADFNNDQRDAGDLGAGHQVTVLYEIVPAGVAVPNLDQDTPTAAPVKNAVSPVDQSPANLLRLRLRYKLPHSSTSTLIEQDVVSTVVAMDQDFRFVSAVAGFAMLLRGSPHAGKLDWPQVIALAESGVGADRDHQRRDFIDLARRAAQR